MDVSSTRDLLLKVPIFSALSPSELDGIISALPRRKLAQNEHLYRDGDPGDSLAVVLAGELSVELEQKGGTPLSIRSLRAGDMVGELACVDPAPRSASVRATQSSEVIEMSRVLLTSIQRSSPKAAAAVVGGITGLVCNRIRETNENVVRSVEKLLTGGSVFGHSGGAKSNRGEMQATRPGQGGLGEGAPHYPLEAEDLRLLDDVGQRQTLSEGDILCAEGTVGDCAFFLIEGRLDVLRQVGGILRLLATIPKGGVVGQLALLDSRVRTATLRARGEVKVLALQRDTFNRLVENTNAFALRFQEHVCVTGIRQLRCATRLHSQMERILGSRENGLDSVKEKLQLNYVATALEEWGLSLTDLDEMVVKTPDGMMTAAEIKARQNIR